MYEEDYSETRLKESTNDASLQCVLKRNQLLGHLGVATDRIGVTSNVRLHWLRLTQETSVSHPFQQYQASVAWKKILKQEKNKDHSFPLRWEHSI